MKLGRNLQTELATLILGLLLTAVGAAGFFGLLMGGSESRLIYPLAALMYVGVGIALYSVSKLWTPDED
jgi:hypothetical protein